MSRFSRRCINSETLTILLMMVGLALASCESSRLGELDAAELRENFPDVRARELAFAAAEGNSRKVRKIIEDGTDVDSLGRDGQSPLIIAVSFNQPDSVMALLDLGAELDRYVRRSSTSPVRRAAGLDDTVILKMLLDHGADPNLGAEWRDAPIVALADAGDRQAVELLAEAGADVNGRGLNDDTAMIAASRHAHYEIVLYLLEQGADYKLINRSDDSLIGIIESRFYRNLNPDTDYRQEVVEFLRTKDEVVEPYE
jgi:ankyrin repeat protein